MILFSVEGNLRTQWHVWTSGLYVNATLSAGKCELGHKKSTFFVKNTPKESWEWIWQLFQLFALAHSSECRFLPIKELDLGKVWEERRGELSVCVCVGVSTSPGRVNNPLLSRWVGSWPRPWEKKKKTQNFHLEHLNMPGRVTSSLTGAEGGWDKSWQQTRARNDVIRDWVEGKIGSGGSVLRKVAIGTTSGDQMRAS